MRGTPGIKRTEGLQRALGLWWNKEECYHHGAQPQGGERLECVYCGEKGHVKRDCRRLTLDERVIEEQEALEEWLRGEAKED